MEEKSSLLPRISVHRPVTVTMCLLAMLVVGAVAYSRISVQLMPSGFTPRFLWLDIGYRDATPQETEQQIARPLEEMLRTVKGIKKIRTYSGSWGVGAPLEFQPDADMDLAYNQIVDRLERLKPDLPEEARDNVWIWKHNQDDWEIMWIGVAVDSNVVDPHQFLDVHVKRPLERLDGVAKVEFWGVYEKEVMIEVDQERMQTRGVSAYELVSSLQQDNFALAGGYVSEGGKKFYVRSLARYRSLEEIRNIQITSRNGAVRLKDLTDVVYDVPERHWHQRLDGRPAVSIGVFRESGANIVTVCENVIAELRRLEAQPGGPDLKFNAFFNQGQFISESVGNLQMTGLWGGLFAALVLLYYLRAIRMTAIITLAIPMCIMITLTALYFFGWSLNLITMMGLMVGVGMVVDNAIVILENIYRVRARGESPEAASIHGASEVGLAITMATMTTVVVFLPLILMSGDGGDTFFLTKIGIPVIVALLGSLFVALIFIPLAAVRLGGSRVKTDPASIRWARTTYHRLLGWTMRHRRDTFLIALVVFASIVIPTAGMKRSDSMRGNINDIRIRVYTPRNLSVEEVRDIMVEIESFMDSRKEVYGVRTIRTAYSDHWGYVHVFLHSTASEVWWYVAYKDLRRKIGYPVGTEMDRKAVIEDLRKKMPRFVGVRTAVESQGGSGGDPSVGVFIYGDDTERLAELSDEVERRIRSIPSVVSVDNDLERADDEVQVRIDREKARMYGISPMVVGRSISYGLQGFTLRRFQTGDGEVRMRGYLEKTDRQTLNNLRSFTFRSTTGEEIPLTAIASLTISRGVGTIRREDGKTRLRVKAFTTKDDIKGLYEEIDRAMQGLGLPRGYSWDKGERYTKYKDTDDTMNFALLMAVTCVFLLMGVLFESFVLPFSVLFSVPFSFLGVYWTLYLTGTPLDGMAWVGIIVLVGVVVNNAIVLVDMVNRLRADGLGRTEAIMEAGHNRFRPILMTTFTTVFGLLPMAVGNANMIGISYAPLGRTMMGGLLCSTFFTLFVVPLFYTYLDDLRLALKRLSTAVFGERKAPAYVQAADD